MSKQAVLSCLSIVSCLMLAASCASPPTDEMAAAEQAVSDAMAAEVDKYAPSEYQSAAAELEKARGHMDDQEYGDARTSALETITLVEKANEEMLVQKELTKREVDEALPVFLERWGEISGSIEQGRGRAARDLAQEAKAFADSLTMQLNELRAAERWYDIKVLLGEANKSADDYAERAGG